jgi:Fic family protein
MEAMLPEDLREQWTARQEKLDGVRRYAEQMPTVEHDPRVDDITAERRRQFVEQAKAAGVPADARDTILRLAAGGVANREVARVLEMSPATAHRYLSALGAEGVIEMRGRGRAAAWHTVTDGTRDDADDDAE